MDTVAVREAFRAFIGDEQFRKFVRTVNTCRHDRLLYWQQQLWQQFTAAQPMMELPAALIREVFQFCEIHGCELEPDTIPITCGLFYFPPEFIEAQDRLFPYARTVAYIDDCFRSSRTEMEVVYCPACRRALASNKRWSRRYVR
jgi:hypothetical protein